MIASLYSEVKDSSRAVSTTRLSWVNSAYSGAPPHGAQHLAAGGGGVQGQTQAVKPLQGLLSRVHQIPLLHGPQQPRQAVGRGHVPQASGGQSRPVIGHRQILSADAGRQPRQVLRACNGGPGAGGGPVAGHGERAVLRLQVTGDLRLHMGGLHLPVPLAQTLRLRRGLFSAAGQQQRRRQQPYQAFFHGKPSLSGRPSVIPTSICLSRCPPRTVMRLAEFTARRPRIKSDPFFAAAPPKGTSVGRVRREKYFARRECVQMSKRLIWTRGSEREPNLSKRAKLFWISLTP